jgi:PKD repeat protein
MFKQIVSNLSFSPQAAGQLTFYLRRLRKEKFTRKLSAVAGIVAFSFQLMATIAPPIAANASGPNDIVYGGIDQAGTPKQTMLQVYDRDHDTAGHVGYQKLFSYFGITRKNIADSKVGTINARTQPWRSLGRMHSFPEDKKITVGGQDYYLKPLALWPGDDVYEALIGKRDDGTPFAIMTDCGNIAIQDQVKVEQSLKCIDLKASNRTGEAPLKVAFTGRGEAEGQKLTRYHFNFGDGDKKDQKDNSVTHTYDKPGKYTATLQVEGSSGNVTEKKDACSVTMEVKPPPAPKDLDCVSLEANRITGTAPLKVTFTGEGKAKNQKIIEYQFNFGDKESKNVDKPTVDHTYKQAGEYTATLAVKGNKQKKVETGPNCRLTITITPTTPGQPNIELAKSAVNLKALDASGQPTDANGTTIGGGATIQYTITTKNTGSTTYPKYEIKEDMHDVLEYANIADTGGAKLVDGFLVWPAIDIAAGDGVVKTFTIITKAPIPTTPRSISDADSFDLCMDNLYGNEVKICLAGPGVKQIEAAATSLPETGTATNVLIMFSFAALVAYFYMRNKQLAYEIQILRNDHNGHH